MQAVNLYIMTRMKEKGFYTEFENVLSERDEVSKVKDYEFETAAYLVQLLLDNGVAIEELDGFYYSYTIKQIGKEFDLLKFCDNNIVLNIELKSDEVDETKISKQLLKNKYYLSHTSAQIINYTYVKASNMFYNLSDESLVKSNINEIVNVMKENGTRIIENIDELFRGKQFLISPLNTPEKFLNNQYFLTQQQDEIKNYIIKNTAKNHMKLWGITGSAGTGKTLLLYDLAKMFSVYGKCCIIHSGILCDGHLILNRMLSQLDIMDAKSISKEKLMKYDYIFVDEAQRIYHETLDTVLAVVEENKIAGIFSYDFFQILSKAEYKRNIPQKLKDDYGLEEKSLSDKIRTNKEISSFIRNLINLNDTPTVNYSYKNIDIVYAANLEEAKKIILYYRKTKKYVFIEYTKSLYNTSSIDEFHGDYNTHKVVGQEFDNVIIILDKNFKHGEDGQLQGKIHPNPDYIFYKLLYQGISRTREKLCIVVIDNIQIFKNLISIKARNKK